MKTYKVQVFISLFAIMISGAAFHTKPDLKVDKTASVKEINKLNKQLRNKYKLNAEIKVLARNSDNTIRHLKFTCNDENNMLPKDGCESENFGVLIIPAPSERGECRCQIADRGTEDVLQTR